MTADTTLFEVATGARATRVVSTLDDVEPELAAFVRRTARWLDPDFPQTGDRGPKERGQWTDEARIVTFMQQVEEYDRDKRGIRTVRLLRHVTAGGSNEGALRVIAEGLANGAVLEVRWNVVVSPTEVHGTSAELTVDGANKDRCIADFREWFGS